MVSWFENVNKTYGISILLENSSSVTKHFCWKTYGISIIFEFQMMQWFQNVNKTTGISILFENSIGQPAAQPVTASPPAAASQAASHSRPASHSQPASQCSKSALDYIQHQIAPRGTKSTTFAHAFFQAFNSRKQPASQPANPIFRWTCDNLCLPKCFRI